MRTIPDFRSPERVSFRTDGVGAFFQKDQTFEIGAGNRLDHRGDLLRGAIRGQAFAHEQPDQAQDARPVHPDHFHVNITRSDFRADVKCSQQGNAHAHARHQVQGIKAGALIIAAQAGAKPVAQTLDLVAHE